MRKPLKVVLIVVLVLVGIYGARILYGLFIFYNVSSEDQLKIAQVSYEKCVAENKGDCEGFLVMGLKAALTTQRQEAMDKQEVDFYYVVTLDDENSLYLSQKAYEYLLEAVTDDSKVVQIQMQTLEDPGAELEYKKKAILALGQAGISEAADVLIKVLGGEESALRYTASRALIDLGAIDKIPDLLKIALDEEKSIPSRSLVIETIGDMAKLYDLENKELIAASLKPLLEYQIYTIRLVTAGALETLTGEEYYDEDREMTEEEIEEYISNTFLENF